MRTRAVQLLINDSLPEHLRQYDRVLDSKALGRLLHSVALDAPDQYAKVVKSLGDIGRNAAYWQGESMSIDDLRDQIDTPSRLAEMDAEVATALKGVDDEAARRSKRESIWGKWAAKLGREVMSSTKPNSVLDSVRSGARGKPLQARAMLSTPALFEDSSGKMVPIFARSSYARGVSSAEWLAGAYGARTSVSATKRCLSRATKVRMADGSIKRMDEIKVGDMVLGADMVGSTFPTKVLRIFDQGLQDVHDWVFRVGYGPSKKHIALQATADHKILATSLRSYSRLKAKRMRGDITVDPYAAYHEKYVTHVADKRGRNFAAVMSGQMKPFDGATHSFAFILGLLAGDGCLSPGKQTNGVRLAFSCADASLLDDLNAQLLPRGLHCRRLSPLNNYDCEITRIGYKASNNLNIVKGTQGFLKGKRFEEKEMLIQSGMWRKYAHEKSLPPDFYTWSHLSMCQYLAGLFTSDGGFTVSPDGAMTVSLYMTAKDLAYQVADVLRWLFGTTISAELVEVDDITMNGVKSQRNHALHGFCIGALCEQKNLSGIWDHMLGAKGRLVRAYLAGKVPKQLGPYSKAYRKESTFLGKMECLDLEVEHTDHLFVLANGLIVSNSTAKGGAWSKLLGQVAAPIMVTENDCGTTNGIDLLADDKSVRNRVLAQDAGNVTSGTLLGRKELAELRNKHKGPLIVRSAITCESPHGVCARCLGADPDGKYPKIGFAAGITASTALGEPVTQAGLNTKHTSGASTQKKEYSGLSWLERFVQIPDNFPDRSPVADADGIVSVKAAPQGGNYVQVGDKEHYVPQHLAVTVHNGDRVEAGQQLSEGIVRPDDIVRYRGIGEGRRYYADRLKQMLDEGGTGADRRNTEVVARGAIDHVQVEDPDDLPDGALPDDMVSYQRALRSFTPPEDSQELNPKNALGLYLQKPALHFTPGTRITPRVADKLAATGFNKVLTHAKAPAFTPRMQRLQTQAFANDDWLASMHTSYLGRQLAQGVTRGQETDVERNIHFAPRLAFGEGFGKDIETTGHF